MADSKRASDSNTPLAPQKPAAPNPPAPNPPAPKPSAPVPESPPATATPTQPAAAAEPHPSSSHRTPREIAKDEAGPGGPSKEPQAREPVLPSEKAPSKEDEHIRAAVQRSAHPDRKKSAHLSTSDPTHNSRKR